MFENWTAAVRASVVDLNGNGVCKSKSCRNPGSSNRFERVRLNQRKGTILKKSANELTNPESGVSFQTRSPDGGFSLPLCGHNISDSTHGFNIFNIICGIIFIVILLI